MAVGQIMDISKRDYFAAQALTGLLSHGLPMEGDGGGFERAAKAAFEYADAMTKQSSTLFDPVEIDPARLGRKEGEAIVEPRLRPSEEVG